MTTPYRAPSIFLPHGGGPMPLLKEPSHAPLNKFLEETVRSLLKQPQLPKAIILVTAHWETPIVNVCTASGKHKLLYDYGGFPPETYNVTFDAHGDAEMGGKVIEALAKAGIKAMADEKRGWDHGVFVPLKILFGDDHDLISRVPVVAIGILESQDASEHYAIGRALESLRNDGIAIVGSGMSYHNLRAFKYDRGQCTSVGNKPFDSRLEQAAAIADPDVRGKKFLEWEQWEGARDAHPVHGADHLMPLIVAAGAGGSVAGKRILTWDAWGYRQAGYVWV